MGTALSSTPIASMTGFARASTRDGDRRIWVEVTSVNHRYLKLLFRIPDPLYGLRPKLEALIKKRVARGALTVTIQYDAPSDAPLPVLNRTLARRYVRDLRRLARELDLEAAVDLGLVAGLPGVLQPVEALPAVSRAEGRAVCETLARAVDKLVADRRREGRNLAHDLARRHRALGRELKALSRQAPAVVEAYARRLLERLKAVLEDTAYRAAPEDVLREVAVYADRVDVSEELTRLAAHLDHLGTILAAGGECGKKIEFLVQEIQREANTIGSKAGSSTVSPHVLAIKGEVEKIREQAQNLE